MIRHIPGMRQISFIEMNVENSVDFSINYGIVGRINPMVKRTPLQCQHVCKLNFKLFSPGTVNGEAMKREK